MVKVVLPIAVKSGYLHIVHLAQYGSRQILNSRRSLVCSVRLSG